MSKTQKVPKLTVVETSKSEYVTPTEFSKCGYGFHIVDGPTRRDFMRTSEGREIPFTFTLKAPNKFSKEIGHLTGKKIVVFVSDRHPGTTTHEFHAHAIFGEHVEGGQPVRKIPCFDVAVACLFYTPPKRGQRKGQGWLCPCGGGD